MPLSVALACSLLVLLAVRRRAEAGRLARLCRAQEQWAADMDRALARGVTGSVGWEVRSRTEAAGVFRAGRGNRRGARSGRLVSQPAEYGGEEPLAAVAEARRLRLAVARHVQDVDLG